jgi:hypothetical protein
LIVCLCISNAPEKTRISRMFLVDWWQTIIRWQATASGMVSFTIVFRIWELIHLIVFQNHCSDVLTIVVHVVVDFSAHQACSAQMLKRSIIAAVFLCAALIQFLQIAIYVGYHTLWNERLFGKSMAYERIQVVATVRRHFAAVRARSVKRLVFLKTEVCFNSEL